LTVSVLRKGNKIIIWPIYFDAKKSRSAGRRVPRNLAVKSPSVEAIREAAERLGLKTEVDEEAAHPSNWRERTGLIAVEKRDSKTKTLKALAKEMRRSGS
jgi:signal recognition particle subunit SRP19